VKGLTEAVAFVLLFVCEASAIERSVLARVTVYWPRERSGGEHASWNGARLSEEHCAVDPKKIPYGSKVFFHDAACVAIDSGPDVINRKAARLCGRNAAERNAMVIDRFFDTKQKALAWAKAHPHFMTVRIQTPGTHQSTELADTQSSGWSLTNIASAGTASWRDQ